MRSPVQLAFTLVELIVVITILAILGTIGFVSLQGYSVNARDSVRISDTKTFLKVLNIYQTKNGEVPLPDDMTTITGSGAVFSYQGTLSGGVITDLGQGQVPLDPLLGTPYLYATNEGRTKVQLLSYHEKNTSSLELQSMLTYAETTYADMFPKTMGDEVGILLDAENIPVQTDIDIYSSGESWTLYGPKDVVFDLQNIQVYLEFGGFKYSCDELLQSTVQNLDSGWYKLTGVQGIQNVYCDFGTQGEGWTLLLSADGDSSVFSSSSPEYITPSYSESVYENIPTDDYISYKYTELKTDDIRLCLEGTEKCFTFSHDLNISLHDFFLNDISYTLYSNNMPNYEDTGKNVIQDYAGVFDLNVDPLYQCQWIGINHMYQGNSIGAIGFMADVDTGCTDRQADNGALGLGLNSCGERGNGCTPGFDSGNAAGLYYNFSIGTHYIHIIGPWYVFGR